MMPFKRHAFSVLCLTFIHAMLAHAYCIKDTFIGRDFFDAWTWQTEDDPTHGRVNYVDKETAMKSNLSFASDYKFVMRADTARLVLPSDRGRDSIRINSNAAYGKSVIVLDLSHMPAGCGTWPAFWTLSKAGPWPKGGEIDIIEGVHLNTNNLASLHTLPGCSMPQWRLQSGKTVSTNCDTSVNYNQGCGTSFNKRNSYGTGFNAAGGGWYVMERCPERGISVWFWSRDDPFVVPREIREGARNIYPNPSWGFPEASFPPNTCDQDTYFDAHQIIFDLTFCGDWAGTVYPDSGCGPGTCDSYVDNNPTAFSEAYWEINSLRVYT